MYIGTQPAIGQNRKLDSIAASFNGVLTTFNLTVNTASIVPSNVYQLFISLGGVLQNPGVDFTANGNQITFTTAPTAGLNFFGIFQGDSITGTPTIADASITTLKLATGLTVTHTAGTAAAPSITFSGDLANGAFAPAANTFGITTGGTERLRIDSGGRLLAGTSTARNNFFGTTLSAVAQVEGTGGAAGRGALSVINNDVSNNPPYVLLGRSGAATLGSNAAVVNGSRLGTLTFHGADGTSFIEAATVAGEVDGTPGTNDMPGRLVFSTTADAAASPTERMRIDSSGRVGIGTTSPDGNLTIGGLTNTGGQSVDAINVNRTDGVRLFGVKWDVTSNEVRFSGNTKNYVFRNGSSEVETARIDSSGRLLVGTSSTSTTSSVVLQGNSGSSTDGSVLLLQRGQAAASISSGDTLGFVRFADNAGNLYAEIRGQTDAAGGSNDYPGRLTFFVTADGASSPSEAVRISNSRNTSFTGAILPSSDNAYQCGASGQRWSLIYAANGTIQTSDARDKTDIASAALGIDFIKKLNPVSYKFVVGNNKESGFDEEGNRIYEAVPGKRTHWGFIAQEVKEAADEFGVDFGGWILTDTEDLDSQQGLRYDQFIAPLTKALQEALAEIDILKAKVASLEAQ